MNVDLESASAVYSIPKYDNPIRFTRVKTTLGMCMAMQLACTHQFLQGSDPVSQLVYIAKLAQ